jgi:hypothetical protein
MLRAASEGKRREGAKATGAEQRRGDRKRYSQVRLLAVLIPLRTTSADASRWTEHSYTAKTVPTNNTRDSMTNSGSHEDRHSTMNILSRRLQVGRTLTHDNDSTKDIGQDGVTNRGAHEDRQRQRGKYAEKSSGVEYHKAIRKDSWRETMTNRIWEQNTDSKATRKEGLERNRQQYIHVGREQPLHKRNTRAGLSVDHRISSSHGHRVVAANRKVRWTVRAHLVARHTDRYACGLLCSARKENPGATLPHQMFGGSPQASSSAQPFQLHSRAPPQT